MQTYKHISIQAGKKKDTYTLPYFRSYIHSYIHACIQTYIQICMRTCKHTYIHTDMQTYMHTYMHTLILTRAARVLIYHQRCCHVSHLQTYMIILRRCCTKNHTYLRYILRRCCNKYHKNLCYIRTKKVLQKSQCITKGAAKTTKQHTAKCNLLHGFSCITKGAAKVPVHYISRIAAPPPAEARFLGRKEAKDGATPLGASWSFLRKVLDLGSAT